MVRFLKTFIPVFFLVVACAEKDVIPKPEGLLSEDKMVAVLTDIHLVEGARTGLVIQGDTIGGIKEHYAAFLNKHQVTQAQFDSSFIYYSKDPYVFDGIYEKVIENLSLMESELVMKRKNRRKKKQELEKAKKESEKKEEKATPAKLEDSSQK